MEEFYHKLAKESSQLTHMMNEAMQSANQANSGTPARAMANLSENVAFMNQMNQMFTYVQLPLKLGNSQAHGDLYVYTTRKIWRAKMVCVTAFCIWIWTIWGHLMSAFLFKLSAIKSPQKFYLDEASIALVKEHMDELSQRLFKRGISAKI